LSIASSPDLPPPVQNASVAASVLKGTVLPTMMQQAAGHGFKNPPASLPSGISAGGPLKVKAPPPFPPCSGSAPQLVLHETLADARRPELAVQMDAHAVVGDISLRCILVSLAENVVNPVVPGGSSLQPLLVNDGHGAGAVDARRSDILQLECNVSADGGSQVLVPLLSDDCRGLDDHAGCLVANNNYRIVNLHGP
jgi:hypothetical protein